MQLPKDYFVFSGIQATASLPAIEAALRVIISFGQLIANRVHYFYVKWTFKADQLFTAQPEYQNIGREFIQKIRDDIRNSPLPDSCVVIKDQPIITLRLGNDDYPVDVENIKLHSGFYRSMTEDFGDTFGDGVGQAIVIPENFSASIFFHLQLYLENKRFFEDGMMELGTFSHQQLMELYELAAYLQISDLEKRCMLLVVETIIHNGSTDLHEYGNVINLDANKDEFTKLFSDIKKFKQDHYKLALDNKLHNINTCALGIIESFLENLAKTIFFAGASLLPWYGPIFAHLIMSQSRDPGLTTLRVMYAIPSALKSASPAIAYASCVAIGILFFG